MKKKDNVSEIRDRNVKMLKRQIKLAAMRQNLLDDLDKYVRESILYWEWINKK